MGNIRYYRGTFKKSGGEDRTMYFVRTDDLPVSFVANNTKGTGRKRKLDEGFETVWDLEQRSWRTFNWNTADTEDVKILHGNENILNNFTVQS